MSWNVNKPHGDFEGINNMRLKRDKIRVTTQFYQLVTFRFCGVLSAECWRARSYPKTTAQGRFHPP